MLPIFLKFLREKLIRQDQVCIGYGQNHITIAEYSGNDGLAWKDICTEVYVPLLTSLCQCSNIAISYRICSNVKV